MAVIITCIPGHPRIQKPDTSIQSSLNRRWERNENNSKPLLGT